MTEVNEQMIKDDLYMAVNGEWLKTAKIPADKSQTGGFQTLADDIEKTLIADFDQMLNSSQVDDQYLNEFIKYYRLALDFEKRDQDGFKPAIKFMQRVEKLTDWHDWEQQAVELTLKGYEAPFSLYVSSDMKNTDQYALYGSVPSLILPDKTYYDENNENGKMLIKVFSQMVLKLFKMAGYDAEFAQKTLKQALEFDASMAPHQKNSTERANYPELYNKYSFDDFKKFSSYLDLGKYAQGLINQIPDQVIIEEPKYYEALDQIVNPNTFENFKSWLLVNSLTGVTSCVLLVGNFRGQFLVQKKLAPLKNQLIA